MIEVIARTKYLPVSPQKVGQVADLVRRRKALAAIDLLDHVNKRAAKPLSLLIRQAVGNAKNNFNLEPELLTIDRIEVLKGPMMKRHRFASRGRVHQIQKKMSHLKLVLKGEKPSITKKKVKKGDQDGSKS
jgi:large subunit ribosomal protein L22